MIEGSCHCGRTGWTFDGVSDRATICNCTLCRKIGVLWIYDYIGGKIMLRGEVKSYIRADEPEPCLETVFCPDCSNVLAWRSLTKEENGLLRAAVNIRLAEPELVADIPIRHFDGLVTFKDLPDDDRCVRNYWI